MLIYFVIIKDEWIIKKCNGVTNYSNYRNGDVSRMILEPQTSNNCSPWQSTILLPHNFCLNTGSVYVLNLFFCTGPVKINRLKILGRRQVRVTQSFQTRHERILRDSQPVLYSILLGSYLCSASHYTYLKHPKCLKGGLGIGKWCDFNKYNKWN